MQRSEFIRVISGGLLLLATGVPASLLSAKRGRTLRFGVVTDIHYADRERSGTRYYRDSMQKLSEAIAEFNRADLDFVIELGDMKDTTKDSNSELTIGFLRDIERQFQSFDGPVYHVLGNHDMDCISKEEFLAATTNAGRANGRSYYSFAVKNTRCIVLDANFNPDATPYCRGNFDWRHAFIPAEQLQWLDEELTAHPKQQTLIFVHQLLDNFAKINDDLCVDNATEVRAIIERHPQVRAVLQGHNHPGHYHYRQGVHYLTFGGMIERAAPSTRFAIVEMLPSGDIFVKGFGDCADREMLK